MDDATKARVQALLAKPLMELTAGEAIFLVFTLEGVDDDVLAELVGLES